MKESHTESPATGVPKNFNCYLYGKRPESHSAVMALKLVSYELVSVSGMSQEFEKPVTGDDQRGSVGVGMK